MLKLNIVWAWLHMYFLWKDTVSTDKKNNEVDGDQDSRKVWASVGHDAVIHDGGPVLTC